jgi:hypothetical protein
MRKGWAIVFARRSNAMNPAISPSRFHVAVAVLASGLAGSLPASAESMPDTENGRYTLQPSADGVIRLDTRTGVVSNCNNSDERKAMDEEIGRLQAENEKLKAELASRESAAAKVDEALPKSDKQAPPRTAEGDRKIEIPLPSDQDVDRVMSFLERAWRKLIDMANRVQKDVSGKI